MKNIKKHLEQIVKNSKASSNIILGIGPKPKPKYVEMIPKTRHNNITN